MFFSNSDFSTRARYGPADDFWYGPVGSMSMAGQRVSPESAMRLSVAWRCINYLSQTVAQLPLRLYRREDMRTKEAAIDHPLYSVLARRPNDVQTSFEWREQAQGALSLRGNAYSEIQWTRGEFGQPVAEKLWPLSPDRVRPEFRSDRLGLIYHYTPEGGETRQIAADSVLHIRGLQGGDYIGLSPIEWQRESLGLGQVMAEFESTFYRNNGQMPGFLKHPAHFRTDEDRTKFANSFVGQITGQNRFKIPVLEHGIDYKEIGLKMIDAQFLDSLKFTDVQICRIFGVPPHKVGLLDRATHNNIEQENISFVVDTVAPLVTRWEQRLDGTLLDDEEQDRYFFDHDLTALLRGDSKARSEYYRSGILSGWLTRNEAREQETYNPLDGLDEPMAPMNMGPGDDLASPNAVVPRGTTNRAEKIEQAAIQAAVRKETEGIRGIFKHNDEIEARREAVLGFYRDRMAPFLERALAMPASSALAYCVESCDKIESFIGERLPPKWGEAWLHDGCERLGGMEA